MYNVEVVILFKVFYFFNPYRNISLDAELSVFYNIIIKCTLDYEGTDPLDTGYNTEYTNCISPQYVQNFERKRIKQFFKVQILKSIKFSSAYICPTLPAL